MAIQYPLSHPTTPGFSRMVMKAENTVGLSISPFTAQQQAYLHQGEYWRAEVSLPPMPRATAEAWVSFLLSCRGMWGTFLLGDGAGKVARGIATGTPVVGSALQTGTSLVTKGWTATQTGILVVGDYIQVPVNLITAPYAMGNASWAVSQCTVGTADAIVAPDGTTTAERITPAGGATNAYLISASLLGISTGATYAFSVYLKAASGTPSVTIYLFDQSMTPQANTVASLTTSWQKFTVSYTAVAGITGLYPCIGGGSSWVVAEGAVDAWGAALTSPGDDSRLYKAITSQNSDGSGNATFDIFPRLRESPVYGGPLVVSSAKGLFRLPTNETQWDIDTAKNYGIGFSAIEAI